MGVRIVRGILQMLQYQNNQSWLGQASKIRGRGRVVLWSRKLMIVRMIVRMT
jgi:hypothetical protein